MFSLCEIETSRWAAVALASTSLAALLSARAVSTAACRSEICPAASFLAASSREFFSTSFALESFRNSLLQRPSSSSHCSLRESIRRSTLSTRLLVLVER